MPIPFLILFGSVVLTSNVAGLRAGLISAAIATAFIVYSASISFGPPALTGGPIQVLLGALIHFATAFFLDWSKSQNRFLIERLQARGESLEELVEAQTSELREANQSLQLEIVEHKRTEKALAQSLTQIERIKQEWEATADSLPELVCLLDNQTRIIRANRTIERWGLKSVSGVRGLGMHDLLHPECTDPACYQRNFWSHAWAELKQNRPIEMEIQDALLNRHLHFEVRPIESETGQHPKADSTLAIVIIHDITERKQAEEALRASEARYRAIVETQTELVVRSKPDGTHTFVNDAYCRQFGKTREELLGTNFIYTLVEEDRQVVHDNFAALTPENPVIIGEYQERRTDGSVCWFRWADRGIFDDKEQLIEVQSVGQDITRRKQAEEALRESEARYRAIVETQTEFVSRTEPDGTITFVNEAYCRQFGQSREELLGTNFINFLVEEDRQAILETIAALTPQNPVSTSEHQEYRPDGSIGWYQWTGRGIFDTKGQLIEMQSVGRDITRRKQAEEALRKSEARYRAVVEDQTELVSRKTPDGTLTFVNDAYCRQFGKTHEALLGTNYFDLLVEEDRQAVREKLAFLSPENPVIVDEHREYGPDGSLAWYQSTSRGIFDEKGQLIEVQSVGRDITERKEAEEALQESEARFQRLAEATFEGIRVSDQGTIVDINDQAGQMFGYEPAEMIGMSALDFVAPESRSLVQKNIMSQYDGPYEYMALRKDGSTFPVEVRVRAFPYRGRMFRISVIRDMTRYKEAEEALRRSEERFSSAFHLNPSAIAISTLEDVRYVDANESFLKYTGYQREEIVGHTPFEINLVVDAEGQHRLKQAVQEDGQVLNQEHPFRTKSGEIRSALVSLEIIELDRKPHVLGMFIDITERKQLEEQLLQTQKMEALNQLATGVVHDFNNLLLVINGFAELINLDLAPDDPHQESLNKIIKSGQQAIHLIHQLVAFSRMQIIDPKVLNLNTIVIEMNRMLQSAIGTDIEVETKLEPDLWLIKVDPQQIEQIIVNLALNAHDAMPDGGRLTIETTNVIFDDDYVAHHLEAQPGEHVVLVISDTGHGMSEEIKSHIFDPFFTTKEQGKGTGLGLASLYGIVKQNGGNILVESEEGVGTTFKIYLPREKEETLPLASSPSKGETETLFGTETILLAEDDPEVRHLIREVLVAQGYTLLETQDGSEALQLAAEYQSSIHLLLADIIMPGMKGTVLAKELIQLRPGLKVLFMTGYTDSKVLGRDTQGFDINILQKPFSPTTLARRVREILDS